MVKRLCPSWTGRVPHPCGALRRKDGKARPSPNLLFRTPRLPHIRQKPGMRRAELGIIRAGLAQAQLPIHRQPDIASVVVLLPVILPPANRAKRKRAGRLQRPVSAAWATKSRLNGSHLRWTPTQTTRFTAPRTGARPSIARKWMGNHKPRKLANVAQQR
jgi:hypothetical protein